MALIQRSCPSCKTSAQIDDRFIGQVANCNKCQTKFIVPAQEVKAPEVKTPKVNVPKVNVPLPPQKPPSTSVRIMERLLEKETASTSLIISPGFDEIKLPSTLQIPPTLIAKGVRRCPYCAESIQYRSSCYCSNCKKSSDEETEIQSLLTVAILGVDLISAAPYEMCFYCNKNACAPGQSLISRLNFRSLLFINETLGAHFPITETAGFTSGDYQYVYFKSDRIKNGCILLPAEFEFGIPRCFKCNQTHDADLFKTSKKIKPDKSATVAEYAAYKLTQEALTYPPTDEDIREGIAKEAKLMKKVSNGCILYFVLSFIGILAAIYVSISGQ